MRVQPNGAVMSDAQGDNIMAGQAAPIEKNYLVGGNYYFGGRFGGLSFLSIKIMP
jgi:hypothetical protein